MVKKPTLWERATRIFQEPTSAAPEAGTITPLSKDSQGIGSFGSLNYAGYPAEEYLHTLRGKRRADIFDQMRRSDPQIKMVLSAVKNPIKAACFEVDAAGDSPEEQADADLIKQILFKDIVFDQFISEALSFVEMGHVVFEPIHRVVLNSPQFGSYNSLKKLAFRSQRTIERWNLEPATGDLISISQYAYGDIGKLVDIPAENLIIISLDQEGANFEGISAIRPCYGSWFRKNTYLKLNAIGVEKFAIPTPLVEVPEGKENTDQYSNMIGVLEHYLTHQNNYLTYPEGWKITLNTNTYDPQKVETSIDNEDKRIVKSFMANFLELGMSGGGGAFALSNDLSDFFLSGLDYVVKQVLSQLNLNLIPNLIKMNRGERPAYPTLKATGITDKAGKELSEILKYLGDSQFIRPDDVLEEHLRKRYQLPEASMEGRRASPTAGAGSVMTQAQLLPPTAPIPPPPPQTLSERIRLSEAKRRKLEG